MDEFNISFSKCENEFHSFDMVNQQLNDLSIDDEIEIDLLEF